MAWVMQHRSGNQDTAVLFPAALLWAGYVLAQGISQRRLGLLLKVILADGDLRAGQLQPTWSLQLEQFPWVSRGSWGAFLSWKLVAVMQESGASTRSSRRALLLGDLSPAGSVTLCWGLLGSTGSAAVSIQSHPAEEGEMPSFESA